MIILMVLFLAVSIYWEHRDNQDAAVCAFVVAGLLATILAVKWLFV